MPVNYQILHHDQFRVLYVNQDEKCVGPTQTGMEAAIETVTKCLDIPNNLPYLNIFLAPDRNAFDCLVAHLTSTPTHPSRIGQPQGNDLYLLSPSAWPVDAVPELLLPNGKYNPGMYSRLLIHETVHVVEEYISPPLAMDVRPAWFSEGLAVYISRQYCKDHDMVSGMISALDREGIPPLNRMIGSAAYLWGWTIIRFLERNFGWDCMVEILRSNQRENILDDFGESLEIAWRNEVNTDNFLWEIRSLSNRLQAQ